MEVRGLLELEGLRAGEGVVIARGRVRGVTIIVTYHPGARLRSVSRDGFATQVREALEDEVAG